MVFDGFCVRRAKSLMKQVQLDSEVNRRFSPLLLFAFITNGKIVDFTLE